MRLNLDFKPIGRDCPLSLCVYGGDELDVQAKLQIWRLHQCCFPLEDDSPDDTLDDFMEHATFCHQQQDCIWVLLFQDAHTEAEVLVAMATAVQYTDSLYVFNLAVTPTHRKHGISKRVLYELEAFTVAFQLPCRLSGSVDACAVQLLKFYQSMGARQEATGIAGPSTAEAPPSIRITHTFSSQEAFKGIRDTDVQISGWLRLRPAAATAPPHRSSGGKQSSSVSASLLEASWADTQQLLITSRPMVVVAGIVTAAVAAAVASAYVAGKGNASS